MLTDKVWHYEKAVDWETGAEFWLVHYAGFIHEARQDGDGSSAYPAILALVESYERVAIGKAAELLGDKVLIQCDTDGLWADVGALEGGVTTGLGFNLSELPREARIQIAIDCVNQLLGALQLREKHNVMRIAMWGPQNYDAGPHSKHSGRPKGVREIRDGVWAGDTFPSVAHQQAKAAPGVYRTEQITWTRPANVIPGWVMADGTVKAVEAYTDQQGDVCIVPWSLTRWASTGGQLWPIQHDALDGLWAPPAAPDADQAPSEAPAPQLDGQGAPAPQLRGLARIKLQDARREHASTIYALRRHKRDCPKCGRRGAQPDTYCDLGYRLAQAQLAAGNAQAQLTDPALDTRQVML
jgi:hypothetical protein